MRYKWVKHQFQLLFKLPVKTLKIGGHCDVIFTCTWYMYIYHVIQWNSSMTLRVGNLHGSISPRPTTLEEDRELFVNFFASILCLWFESQTMRTYNFLTEFQTLMTLNLEWKNELRYLFYKITIVQQMQWSWWWFWTGAARQHQNDADQVLTWAIMVGIILVVGAWLNGPLYLKMPTY